MSNKNNNLRDLFAQGRAIHLAMRHGQITYEQAKIRVEPFLRIINSHITLISKQHKRKPRLVRFQDLGRNL